MQMYYYRIYGQVTQQKSSQSQSPVISQFSGHFSYETKRENKAGVINDPLGQTHSLISGDHCFRFVLFCQILKSGDGRMQVRTNDMCKNNDHYRLWVGLVDQKKKKRRRKSSRTTFSACFLFPFSLSLKTSRHSPFFHFLDPLGQPPTVEIIVFSHVVRMYINVKNLVDLAKQNKENNVHYWQDFGFRPSGSLMTPLSYGLLLTAAVKKGERKKLPTLCGIIIYLSLQKAMKGPEGYFCMSLKKFANIN